jgi:Na+/H+ antiporter NhaD/arsenite permease-like protein
MAFHQLAATAVFLIVYAIILAGENSPRKLDRPAAGLIGGVLLILTGVLTRQQAVAAIDFSTLVLLFGMMVIVHFASEAGLLDRAASALITRSATPHRLLWAVGLSAGVLSALFVNDTVCLLMTPLLLAVTRRKGIAPEPFLIALATSSNVGSVMTLTGNPQNMLIGQSSHWTWGAYALRMVPIGAVCLAANAMVVAWVYRRALAAQPVNAETVEAISRPVNRKLAAKSLVVMGALLVALLAGAPMDMAALTAATVLLVIANRPPSEAFASVDWALLLFFGGLFVVVHGLLTTQAAAVARFVPAVTDHVSSVAGLLRFSGLSVVGSNLFSNVPFVMLIRTWIAASPDASLLWLALAMSSTFAGNLTLLGSVANLIVAQGAKDECSLSFVAFLRVGVPTTLLTVLLGTVALAVYRMLGWT